MKYFNHLFAATLFVSALFVASCTDREPNIIAAEPNLPVSLANYAEPETAGSYWINEQLFNVTDAGATLGRVLFYDKILSRTNKISCGSCHIQEKSFSDPVAISSGFDGQILDRHTPSIVNLYDDNFLFWDGRTKTLEELVLKPVRNHKEMGLDDMDFLLAKLNRAPYYKPLFEDAFNSSEITRERVSSAIAQFLRSMITANSKFDRVMAGEASFDPMEELGQQVFFGEGRCYNCHLGQDFNERGGFFGGGGWAFNQANIGLDEEYSDQGMGEINPDQLGEFKIPSLRNIAVTAPYMHDGRFGTLEEVINHYNKGIQDHPNLAFELEDWNTSAPVRLGLDENQVIALTRFLETLTDDVYLTDQKYSDPFGL